MRYTPETITKLEENQIFVFGSNQRGAHGAGAALLARKAFGAVLGDDEGLTGQCYALPTKDENIQTRPLDKIGESFRKFIKCVLDHPELDFLLTKVGCGLAGLNTNHVAREFWRGMTHNKQEKIPVNLWIPKEFVFTADHEESLFEQGGNKLKETPIAKDPFDEWIK